jgi:hypothetical protein
MKMMVDLYNMYIEDLPERLEFCPKHQYNQSENRMVLLERMIVEYIVH